MTSPELMIYLANIVVENSHDDFTPLTSAQLREICGCAETIILNEAHMAPCSHSADYSKYKKEREPFYRCGCCMRPVESVTEVVN